VRYCVWTNHRTPYDSTESLTCHCRFFLFLSIFLSPSSLQLRHHDSHSWCLHKQAIAVAMRNRTEYIHVCLSNSWFGWRLDRRILSQSRNCTEYNRSFREWFRERIKISRIYISIECHTLPTCNRVYAIYLLVPCQPIDFVKGAQVVT